MRELVADMPPLLRALLVERFGASPLAYHNLSHIQQMLAGLPAFEPLSERDARVLRYAIWLHDAFYDPQAKDNERRSADIGLALLQWPEDELRDFEACVMATKGHATDHPLAQKLVDLDLSILAAEREAYRRYALAIRDEYRVFQDKAYRAGRIQVLDQLSGVPLLRVCPPRRGWPRMRWSSVRGRTCGGSRTGCAGMRRRWRTRWRGSLRFTQFTPARVVSPPVRRRRDGES